MEVNLIVRTWSAWESVFDLAAGRADGHNTGNNLSGKWWRGAGAGALDPISLLLQVGTFIFGRWQIGRIERFMS